jgi:hypothetical protein
MSSDSPSDRSAPKIVGALGNNGGWFFRSDDPAAPAARERIGEEAFEPVQRSRELLRHPRPLTATERAAVRESATPLLQDLAASGIPHWLDPQTRDGAALWVCPENGRVIAEIGTLA